MKLITTFPRFSEFEKVKKLLDQKRVMYTILSPEPCYTYVGVPAVIIEERDRALCMTGDYEEVSSGWIDFSESPHSILSSPPLTFEHDIFGRAAVMVLQPCVADQSKIRAIVHISGNVSEAFPYLNAIRSHAIYNVEGPTFTFMDEFRMISVYPSRIAVAKADDIVDVWRILEGIRVSVNTCWSNRSTIEPSYELRKRPAALEIYFHLPKTNCGQCGEKTCLAFALNLWSGQTSLFKCKPIFKGNFANLRTGLFEICAGLDIFKE